MGGVSVTRATQSSGMIGSVSFQRKLMLRFDMEWLAPRLGRAIAIAFPTVAVIVIALVVALIGAAVIWHRIAPLRERVRLANEEADRRQRKVTKQAQNDT
jgi:hypothetical protein